MEITILKWFEQIRNPFLTFFNLFFTFLGEDVFVIGIILSVFWLFSRHRGEQLAMAILSVSCVGSIFKLLFARTRPFASETVSRVEFDSPFVSTMDLNINQSFPSGHSLTAATFYGTIASFFKEKKWIWVSLACLITFLIMLSRLYLGVHYPTDTIVGALLGILFCFLWIGIYKYFYKKRYWIFLCFSIIFILLLFIPTLQTYTYIKLISSCFGSAVGLLLMNRFSPLTDVKSWKKRFLRMLIGVVTLLFVFLLFRFIQPKDSLPLMIFTFIQYFTLLFISTFIVPLFFNLLHLN